MADAHALGSRHGYQPVQAICLRLLAECHASRGAWAEAEMEFRAASAMLAELGMRPERVRAEMGLAQALAALGRAAEAAEVQAAAVAEAETICLDPRVTASFPGIVP